MAGFTQNAYHIGIAYCKLAIMHFSSLKFCLRVGSIRTEPKFVQLLFKTGTLSDVSTKNRQKGDKSPLLVTLRCQIYFYLRWCRLLEANLVGHSKNPKVLKYYLGLMCWKLFYLHQVLENFAKIFLKLFCHNGF